MQRRAALLLLEHIEFCFENHKRIQRKGSDFLVDAEFMELVHNHVEHLKAALEKLPGDTSSS